MDADTVQLWRCYSGIGAFAAAGAAMVAGSLLKPKPALLAAAELPAAAGGQS
jgi:hypothetical protein